MTSKYREEELLDSLVIDKEGYICGRIASFSIEPDKIRVNLYDYGAKNVERLDGEELVKRLLEVVPKKLASSLANKESFFDWVRETLNLTNTEPVTSEQLIKFAKIKKVEIPYNRGEVNAKVDKGFFYWSLVNKTAFTELGKCVLLNKAVEADKRGIKVEDKIGYRSTQQLIGRIVIDSEAKIFGRATKFLIGIPPGIVINVERLMKEERIDFVALKKLLIPAMFPNSTKLLEQVKKDLRLKIVKDSDLATWAKKRKINVPTRSVMRTEIVKELIVDWGKVAKIGDVVMLKKNIEDLIDETTHA